MTLIEPDWYGTLEVLAYAVILTEVVGCAIELFYRHKGRRS